MAAFTKPDKVKIHQETEQKGSRIDSLVEHLPDQSPIINATGSMIKQIHYCRYVG
jgi:hypothetical protein